MRRSVMVVLGLAGLLASLFAVPSTASASLSCSPTVQSKVWIDRPYTNIPVSLSTDCYYSGVDYASWDVVHRYYGPSDIVIMDGVASDTWSFYDWDDLGSYDLVPSLCYDWAYNNIPQGRAYVSVRLGSRVSVKAVRSGKYVTLTATGQRYYSSRSGFGSWGGAKVSFETRAPGGSWTYVKWLYLNSSGQASVRVYAPNVRYWHAKLNDSSNTWGRTSATVSR